MSKSIYGSAYIGDQNIRGTEYVDVLEEFQGDATNGIVAEDVILYNGTISGSLIALTDGDFPRGFVNTTDQTSTFTDGTRTWEISPAVTSFSYYSDGIKYDKTSAQSLATTDVEGTHMFYFDGATLSVQVNPTGTQISAVIRSKCLVGWVYWDATNNTAIYETGDNEYHTIGMTGSTHSYLHNALGAQYISGCALNTLAVDQDGSLDTHAQFGVDAGVLQDEDISVTLAAVLTGTGCPVYYRDTADWRRDTNAGFSALTTGTGRLAYDNSGTLTEVTDGRFVLYHVFGFNDSTTQFMTIMGQAEYLNQVQARIGAVTEINNLNVSGLPFAEMIPVATVIYQTNDTYGNAVKARIRSTDGGDDYVDWRFSGISQTAVPTSHSTLTDLGNDDHPHYALIGAAPSRVNGIIEMGSGADANQTMITFDTDTNLGMNFNFRTDFGSSGTTNGYHKVFDSSITNTLNIFDGSAASYHGIRSHTLTNDVSNILMMSDGGSEALLDTIWFVHRLKGSGSNHQLELDYFNGTVPFRYRTISPLTGFDYNVPTGDTYVFNVNSSPVLTLAGTGITSIGTIDSSLTADRLLASGGSKELVSVADLTNWIAGTANEITSTADGSGGIILAIPDSPILTNLTVTSTGSTSLVINRNASTDVCDLALQTALTDEWNIRLDASDQDLHVYNNVANEDSIVIDSVTSDVTISQGVIKLNGATLTGASTSCVVSNGATMSLEVYATTDAYLKIDGDTNSYALIDRGNAAGESYLIHRTNGVPQWKVGLDNSSTNYEIYNDVANEIAVSINSSTSEVTITNDLLVQGNIRANNTLIEVDTVSASAVISVDRPSTTYEAIYYWQTANSAKWKMHMPTGATQDLIIYNDSLNENCMEFSVADSKVTIPNGNLVVADPNDIYCLHTYSSAQAGTTRPVVVDNTTGEYGYASSIRESKINIKPLDGSYIYSLKPSEFYYRKKVDGVFIDEPNGYLQNGFIAEECPEHLQSYDILPDGSKKLATIAPAMSFVAGLVACAQEAKNERDLLKEENKELRNRVLDLEGKMLWVLNKMETTRKK